MEDLTGKKFGKLTVLKPGKKINRKQYWICICDCGTAKEIRSDSLKAGKIISCGCIQEKADIIGKRFGHLTVIAKSGTARAKNGKNIGRYYNCACDCGNTAKVLYGNLISGKQISCGCVGKAGRSKEVLGHIENTNIYRISGKQKKREDGSIVGVIRKRGKWCARITFKGKTYWLGTFWRVEDANSARMEAEKNIYGPFLEWYAENYPEKWEKMQKNKK